MMCALCVRVCIVGVGVGGDILLRLPSDVQMCGRLCVVFSNQVLEVIPSDGLFCETAKPGKSVTTNQSVVAGAVGG